MHHAEHRQGKRKSLIMDYSFWERLTSAKHIARGDLTPRCDICRTRTQKQASSRLFLLPVYNDKDYTPSAEYYSRVCRPISQVKDIPVGQRACRMWPLICPSCGARAVLVVDFLTVRGQEVTEKLEVCEYAPLVGLLNAFTPQAPTSSGTAQSFGYEEIRKHRN